MMLTTQYFQFFPTIKIINVGFYMCYVQKDKNQPLYSSVVNSLYLFTCGFLSF